MDADQEKALANGTHAVLIGLLAALADNGQSEIVKKAFDLAGETYVIASMSENESLRSHATATLEVIDNMRKAIIG